VIKAVFFDWFNTLAHYYPSREQLESQALKELGFLIVPETMRRALYLADKYYYEEQALFPLSRRGPAEQVKVFLHYQRIVLQSCKIPLDDALAEALMKRTRELNDTIKFVLYDDVAPALSVLRQKQITVGIISNLQSEINSKCRELGIANLVDFTVTSGEVGADKPEPPIFLRALFLAKTAPGEAIHVGDQYQNDVVGARNVGINPVLLDRDDVYQEITDCPRINRLTEIDKLLG
jgi:putative hydrolase of the HAD superfamily